MNSIELLKNRRSIRRFTDEIVSEELINEIIEITRFSPSWKNFQIARYNIVQNEEILQEISTKGVNDFIYNSKTILQAKNICVLSYVKGVSGKHETGELASSKTDWEVFDAGIAALQFCLAAYEKGIGSVIMGIIDDEVISNLIDLPDNEVVGAIIAFGHPKYEHPKPTPRKDVSELVRFKK